MSIPSQEQQPTLSEALDRFSGQESDGSHRGVVIPYPVFIALIRVARKVDAEHWPQCPWTRVRCDCWKAPEIGEALDELRAALGKAGEART